MVTPAHMCCFPSRALGHIVVLVVVPLAAHWRGCRLAMVAFTLVFIVAAAFVATVAASFVLVLAVGDINTL